MTLKVRKVKMIKKENLSLFVVKFQTNYSNFFPKLLLCSFKILSYKISFNLNVSFHSLIQIVKVVFLERDISFYFIPLKILVF